MQQKRGSNRRHDNVVMVGQVESTTVQVLIPDAAPNKFIWRIIKDDGKDVTSGMIFYTTAEAAMEAALKIVLPDSIPVAFREPAADDFEALNVLLFGFKKGDPITTFQGAFTAFQFLTETYKVLKAAQAAMPQDYENIIAALAASPAVDFDLVQTTRSLQALAIQSQEMVVDMCLRDLETLGSFLQEFIGS